MEPAHHFKLVIIKALYADRKAVYACRSEIPHKLESGGIGIALGGYLSVRRNIRRRKDIINLCAAQERWCSAAEINGIGGDIFSPYVPYHSLNVAVGKGQIGL